MNIDGDGSPSDPGDGEGARGGAELRCWGVPAEPARFPALRRALAGWAEHVGMSPEQIEVLALTSYEALANAAAHAYPDQSVGVLDMHAIYWPASAQVEVTVIDYGRWQPPAAERGDLGGRGLVLIESLAEHAEVSTGPTGTSVRMSWTLPRQPVAV